MSQASDSQVIVVAIDWHSDVIPTPAPDGMRVLFNVGHRYKSNSLEVIINGQDLLRDVDFVETNDVTGDFTMTIAPDVTDSIWVNYIGTL